MFFTIYNSILDTKRERIIEHGSRSLKADQVLAEITTALFRIPFK